MNAITLALLDERHERSIYFYTNVNNSHTLFKLFRDDNGVVVLLKDKKNNPDAPPVDEVASNTALDVLVSSQGRTSLK
jgi:hypothetical protein